MDWFCRNGARGSQEQGNMIMTNPLQKPHKVSLKDRGALANKIGLSYRQSSHHHSKIHQRADDADNIRPHFQTSNRKDPYSQYKGQYSSPQAEQNKRLGQTRTNKQRLSLHRNSNVLVFPITEQNFVNPRGEFIINGFQDTDRPSQPIIPFEVGQASLQIPHGNIGNQCQIDCRRGSQSNIKNYNSHHLNDTTRLSEKSAKDLRATYNHRDTCDLRIKVEDQSRTRSSNKKQAADDSRVLKLSEIMMPANIGHPDTIKNIGNQDKGVFSYYQPVTVNTKQYSPEDHITINNTCHQIPSSSKVLERHQDNEVYCSAVNLAKHVDLYQPNPLHSAQIFLSQIPVQKNLLSHRNYPHVIKNSDVNNLETSLKNDLCHSNPSSDSFVPQHHLNSGAFKNIKRVDSIPPAQMMSGSPALFKPTDSINNRTPQPSKGSSLRRTSSHQYLLNQNHFSKSNSKKQAFKSHIAAELLAKRSVHQRNDIHTLQDLKPKSIVSSGGSDSLSDCSGTSQVIEKVGCMTPRPQASVKQHDQPQFKTLNHLYL